MLQVNSGSASAPSIKASKFLLAFSLPIFNLKINELNIFSLGFYLIFKTERLPTFSYFCIVLDVNSLQTILFFLYTSKL